MVMEISKNTKNELIEAIRQRYAKAKKKKRQRS
jgi:hypothetical protein